MKKNYFPFLLTGLLLLTVAGITASCLNDPDPEAALFETDVPDVYRKIYGASSVTRLGDYVEIKTTSVPDHKSPYFQNTQWATTHYEPYSGTNTAWKPNSNKIATANYTFRLPVSPKEAIRKSEAMSGPIGIVLNGIPFFSQPETASATDDLNSLDQYGGHPAATGDYHYRTEPVFLTTNKGKEALLGFMLDGFPVYGPVEKGKIVAVSSLDSYRGHRHATADFPQGIYHYHITATEPYIHGSGFYGTPGTCTKLK